MRDMFDLGCTPGDEKCEQIGPNYDPVKARAECLAYINQLERIFGEPPYGTRFKITSNPHDFGSYLDVCIVYDSDDEESSEYAFRVEGDCPGEWDDEARAELGLTTN